MGISRRRRCSSGTGMVISSTPSLNCATHKLRCQAARRVPRGENVAQILEIANLVDAGKLKVIVGAVFPLAEAAKAHELSATLHARGKIVLRVI